MSICYTLPTWEQKLSIIHSNVHDAFPTKQKTSDIFLCYHRFKQTLSLCTSAVKECFPFQITDLEARTKYVTELTNIFEEYILFGKER